ncbi:hypothetical protein P4O66_013950, partial [Electrophorus voltai]
ILLVDFNTCSLRYPLHDPERLQLWLKHIGCGEWTPSGHQYLCHEHFEPSCFISRWGMRYLANNAMPTIFDLSEPSKITATQSGKVACRNVPVVHDCCPGAVKLCAVTVKSSTPSEELPLPVLNGTGNRRLAVTSGSQSTGTIPVMLLRSAGELVCCRDSGRKVVVVFKGPSSDVAEVCIDAAASVIMNMAAGVEQKNCDLSPLAVVNAEGKDSTTDQQGGEVQVVACFDMIPSVPCPLSSISVPAGLPGLYDHPMPSPGSLVLTLEKLVSVTEEGLQKMETDAQQSSQLEEHRLSKDQLGAIATELQKRVKVLQQRHRRHLEKLLGLESVAAQLRQSNLLMEERLQLLEKVYLQTSAAVSDTGKTVAIIYEDDNTPYV